MAEEIDLNTENLCTTVDAFEKFQAISMYQENEYITLGDIVPQQSETPVLTSMEDEIKYDSEVVLKSPLEEQVFEVNSTIECSSEENKPADASSQEDPPKESHQEAPSESQVRKRGRRKKNQQSLLILPPAATSNKQNNVDPMPTPNSQPTTPTPRRRGRPRKINTSVNDDHNNLSHDNVDSTSNTPIKTVYDNEQSPLKTQSPNISLNDNLPVENTAKRRGRKKKQSMLEVTYEKLDYKECSDNVTSVVQSKENQQVDQTNNDIKLRDTEIIELPKQSPEENDNDTPSIVDKKTPKRRRSIKLDLEENLQSLDKKLSNDASDDEADDICLSKLKMSLDPNITAQNDNDVGKSVNSEAVIITMQETKIEIVEDNCITEEPAKRMTKKPTMTDFEYNVDIVCNEKDLIDDNNQSEKIEDSLLVEDTSKRPVRRKVKQTMHYEEESDDPYANMESSDDERPKRGKKGSKYYSDDEYVPGALKRGNESSSELSGIDDDVDELIKKRRKKKRTHSSLDKTPKKRGKKPKYVQEIVKSRFSPEVQTFKPNDGTEQTDDVEVCLQTSVIKTNDDSSKKLGWKDASSEFTNFIAKKIQGTDIKITKATSVQPIEIPVLDPNLVKKTVEASAQTTCIKTTSVEVQTSAAHDFPMKDNVSLTGEQSDKACEFLKGIVKTTAELGELMTQKSEDFIKKKINSSHVTDTFKMDYCVRKSFLLFKLAKHNLMQMEEDLAKQYNEFLNNNNLSQYREQPKLILATEKPQESDSDCEIIEGPVIQKPKPEKTKPKFNPKTVFLNKELSIKIAKKPSKEKRLNVKNPHTVWINDSVLVKKVKPTQSFLAQDSRNKKPPDCVTIEMVNDFFKEYYRQQALITCAPFLSTEWLLFNKKYQCSYFFTETDDFANSSLSHEIPSSSRLLTNTVRIESEGKYVNCVISHGTPASSPKSLFSLCLQILSKHIFSINPQATTKGKINGYTFSPKSLHCLCVNNINSKINASPSILIQKVGQHPMPLKTLCLKIINNVLIDASAYDPKRQTEIFQGGLLESKQINNFDDLKNADSLFSEIEKRPKTVNSLFSLCVQLIQSKLRPIQIENCINDKEPCHMTDKVLCHKPNTLKNITLKNIIDLIFDDQYKIIEESKQIDKGKTVKSLSNLCFEIISQYFANCDVKSSKEYLTINSVNTLTEEAYLNIEPSHDTPGVLEYYADDNNDFYEDETEDFTQYDEISHTEENNWISQVQNELKTCFVGKNLEASEVGLKDGSMVTKIKIEPEDDNIVDTSIVKTEPVSNLDEMISFPDHVITKAEAIDHVNASGDVIHRKGKSYDVETFEAFVKTNKMMHVLNECPDFEDLFSQGSSRIRRQYEPDSDPEYDMDMSLLIPQTYEPMHIENAKDSLMESSGDEGNTNKKTAKKKPDKRKGKSKKNDSKMDKQTNEKTVAKESSKELHKTVTTKEIPKTAARESTKEVSKTLLSNEVTILTRRMRDKIRQEEKKVASSDSESEEIPMILQKDKENNIVLPRKLMEKTKQTNKTKSKSKNNDDAIQCNSVDSTEQIKESPKICESPDPSAEMFTGFTSVDQSDISNYQKYLKYLSGQVTPSPSDNNGLETETGCEEPVINPEEPVELLECEPTMPILDDDLDSVETSTRKSNLRVKEIKPTIEQENIMKPETKPYVDRNGWSCYQLDINDTKLYQEAQILLEKLPESFVDIYFKYQSIADKDEVDEEVERLTNLQSLNRSIKEGKIKSTAKSKVNISQDTVTSNESAHPNLNSRTTSPIYSEGYNELTPSEDEGDNADEKTPSVPNENVSENNMAKSSLMDDNESEDESGNKVKVKTEPIDNSYEIPQKKCRPCPKSKKKTYEQLTMNSESLMLTADKMMNKELNMLHAPVVLDEGSSKTPVKGPVTRNKTKTSTKNNSETKHVKTEEDSSSEEEKQWFTIKEKLLKRMINKKDSIREDDAKRAKLVNEYIERREEQTENYLKRRKLRGRRSTKKMLERQKQLKVLSRELFGDTANDPTLQGKSRYSQTNFKGRRNIRKVIDKKSLAKSTVVANMEEFERKRRLNIRHNKLREILRCEEGVNVLVINDEVCLEYDFEERQPVVTIHSFFTKVMKAHQYEGVKFMWDACFESLERVESGDGGGGCILAHCMGLGKTLQVLALLHTVLTHPRVKMQRVLVCCPLSTVLNWVDEIHKWIGPVTAKIKVFELSKLKKTYERAYQLEDWYNGGGIFIIGYELFRSLSTLDPDLDDVRPTIINKIRTALLDPGPDIIICDEGHLLKNDCSVLAVAMSRVVTKRRIVLTGTPMQNNLREYYCMVNFIKPNLLGTYAEYSNRFENPIMNGQHRDSREEDIKLMKARTHILHKVLEGCLQRQEASVLYPYLPKKHEYTVFVSLTKCQWDLYKHYMENYANSQNKSVLKDFHILQKIWSHPQVLHNFQTRTSDCTKNKVKLEKLEDDLAREDLNADLNPPEDLKPSDSEVWWLQYLEGGAMLNSLHSSNKFVAVFRILDECIALGDKLLIFSTSLFTMDSLEYFLRENNKWSLGREYYRLDGSVPAEVRQKWCREFNAENNHKTKLFLISTRAGSLGLNMVAANRVIILDTSWNPAHDIQSIFRVYRFGQKKDCYIYRLVALGTMEQKIYERSVTKQAVACRVLDEQQIDRHYNMADLTELYRYDESGLSVAGGVAVGVCDVALLRVARDANIHAVHEHDSLLRGSAEQGLPEHERNAAWMQFQQEHAHKQMQNDLETEYEKAKLTIKHVHGHNYSLSPTLNPAVKTETDEEVVPVKTETKSKRNKKNSIVSCCIPIEPETSSLPIAPTIPPDQEEAVVKQIASILLKHDFKKRSGAKEISTLVANVQRIVESGQIASLENEDDLTKSIAQVLLQRALPMPALSDIVCESVNNTIKDRDTSEQQSTSKVAGNGSTPTVKRSKRKCRKGYVYEEIVPEKKNSEIITDGRRKRRAALEAEKSFDVIGNDIIDLDNDRDDSDFEPDILPDTQSKVKTEPKENSTKNIISEAVMDFLTKKIKPTKNVIHTDIKIQEPVMDTILLSDEELPKPKRPGPARKLLSGLAKNKKQKESTEKTPKEKPAQKSLEKSKEKSAEKVAEKPVEKPAEDPEENIPLPPSLLQNENFIKIVAHTYLNSNPILDEDAAMLAALYSTQKALKDYENSGRTIVSGPLHDIAKKVLGENVLKKLKPTTPIKAPDAPQSSASNVSPNASKIAKEVKSEPVKPSEPKQPIKLTIKLPTSGSMLKPIVTSSSVVHIPIPTNVVPVGMFRGANAPQSTEESILPDDDDDIRIITNPPPPVPAKSLSRRNAKQLLLTSVTTEPKSSKTNTTPLTRYKKIIQATSNEVILPNLAMNTIQTANDTEESILSDINNTISLDSEDEDDAPLQPAAPVSRIYTNPTNQPVPVSLTKVSANPNVFIIPSKVMANNSKTEQSHKVSSDLSKQVVDEMIVPNLDTTESLASTSIRSAKSSKQMCKPGDILRITKTGAIEVLKRVDSTKSSKISLRPQDKQETLKKKVSSIEESVAVVANESTSKNSNNLNDIRVRPTSPFDPLSILKDVIHIEADDYSTQSSTNKKTSKETTVVNTSREMTPKKTVTGSNSKDEKKEDGRFHNVLSHRSTKINNYTNNSSKLATTGTKNTPIKTQTTPITPKPIPGKGIPTFKSSSISKTSTDLKDAALSKSIPSTSETNSSSLKTTPRLSKTTPTSSINTPSSSKNTLSSSKPTISLSKNTPSSSKPTPSLSKNTPSLSKTTLSSSTSTPVSKITPPGNLEAKKTSRNQITAAKGAEVIYDSVDLTNVDATSMPKADNPNRKVLFTSTVVGTSKDIIIGGAGKTLSKRTDSTVSSTTSQPAPVVKVVVAPKRPASSDTTTAKKKKTDKPMTLKDFDIDDIDDIIELD